MNQNQNDIYLLRTEELCYALRDAMIDFSLKCPDLSSFERYLGLLTNEEDLQYIIKLLHECWLFVNPYYLFNGLPKNLPQEELIELALSKYGSPEARGFDYLKEANTPNFNPLLLAYYQSYNDEPKYQLAYEDYMKELFLLTKNICGAKGLTVCEGFVIDYYLTCNISYPKQESVYNMAVGDELFDDTKDNRHTFLSLFRTSPEEPKGQIRWMVKNEKNERPSYATLYVFFEAIGVDMHSRREKEVICKHFLDCSGQPIKVEQLKRREPSHELQKLAEKVKQALQES